MHHAQQLADIARVQSDARFIHDKERVDERCAKTSRQVYSLNFAAAQRARGSIKRKITDADLAQIVQACADFVTQHLSGFVSSRNLYVAKKIARIGNRKPLKLGKI